MKKSILMIAALAACTVAGSAVHAASWTASGGAGTFLIGPNVGDDYVTLADFFKDATGVWEATGTVTSAGVVITGTGTSFLTEGLVPGDRILASTGAFRGTAQVLTIVSIDSPTQITVAAAPSAALAGNICFQRAAAPTPISGNVLLSITGNITEPNNIGVTLATGANTVTIKPAPATTATISFTRVDDQAGFSGHLIFGTMLEGANAVQIGTNNFVIDGSNTVAGTTRDLTLTSSATFGSSVLVHLTADADNFVLKNTIVTHAGAATGSSTAAFRATSLQYAAGVTDFTAAGFAAAGTYTPDNWTVENCELNASVPSQGHGVLTTVTGTVAAGTAMNGFVVRNNVINARIRGVFVNNGYGYTVEGNTITSGAAGVTTLDTWGIFNNNSNTPPANTTIVRNNTINVTNASAAATTTGAQGIFMGSMGTGFDRVCEIYNNSVVVVNTGARNAGVNPNLRGIGVSSAITSRIYNNSISIPDNAGTTNTITGVAAYGIGGFASAAANIDSRNNIVSVGEANVPAFSQNVVQTGVGSGYLSDYNTVFVSGGALVGRTVTTTYATLPLWQAVVNAGCTYDPNGDVADPTSFWTADLHLNAVPGIAEVWGGTPISVTTDRDGDVRNGTYPYRGADELATALVASVADWTMINE